MGTRVAYAASIWVHMMMPQCLIHQAGSATVSISMSAKTCRLNALFIRQVVQRFKFCVRRKGAVSMPYSSGR